MSIKKGAAEVTPLNLCMNQCSDSLDNTNIHNIACIANNETETIIKVYSTAKMIPGRQAVSRFATHETCLLRNLTLPPPYKLMDFLLQTPTYLIFSGSCWTCFSDIPQLSQTST